MGINHSYASFMLRLQWTQTDNRPTWVASIQSAQTGEQRWFPSLDALIQFLREEFGGQEQAQSAGLDALLEKDRPALDPPQMD